MSLILVIEDDVAFRNSIKLILELEGFDVCTAKNGESGLAMIRERRPDLILCDIMMPGMDGYSVLQNLKSDSAIADVPFIFVSALGERSDVRRGMSEGAEDYLSKPFTAEELVTAVVGRLHRIDTFRTGGLKIVFEEEYALLREQVTARELEILLLVGVGSTSKKIAAALNISVNTVEVHRASLMRKLDAINAANLARWAVIAEHMSSTLQAS